jgi:flagellin
MTSILTNVGAISALQTLRSINASMAATQGQVSSGLRIESADDNAAYWSIATTMKSDNKALSAVADALGLGAAKIDVAYSGMDAVIDVMSEFKAKLVAAREPGVDKAKIQKELEQLKEQVVSISTSASFGGQNWLNTDIAELVDPALNKVSFVSSFVRSRGGSVAVETADLGLDEISLFNKTGGGLLQSAKITKTVSTPGGLVSNIGGLQNGAASDLPHYGHSWFIFSGARSLSATDQISFDISIDANGAYTAGSSYSVTIDQALVNAALGKSDGSITNSSEMSIVLKSALAAAGAPADSSRDYHYWPTSSGSSLVDIFSVEALSPGLGSSISISNVTSTLASGYNFGMSQISSHNNITPSAYVPFTAGFQFQMTATSQFSFDVNFPTAGTSQSYTVTKADVDAALGTSDGIVGNLTDFATVLGSVVSDLTFSQSSGNLWISPDPSGPHIGRHAIFSVSNMTVTDILTVETTSTYVTISGFDFLSIDVTDPTANIDDLISAVDVMTEAVVSGASVLGALQSRIDMQSKFSAELIDTIDKGIGRLVDADMNEESTRLKALETQQQLGIQALQIANSNSENVMALFR